MRFVIICYSYFKIVLRFVRSKVVSSEVTSVALLRCDVMWNFQVLTAASMMFRAVFWVVLLCKMIVDRRYRGAYCLHHEG
jgi:hypothetical protein